MVQVELTKRTKPYFDTCKYSPEKREHYQFYVVETDTIKSSIASYILCDDW